MNSSFFAALLPFQIDGLSHCKQAFRELLLTSTNTFVQSRPELSGDCFSVVQQLSAALTYAIETGNFSVCEDVRTSTSSTTSNWKQLVLAGTTGLIIGTLINFYIKSSHHHCNTRTPRSTHEDIPDGHEAEGLNEVQTSQTPAPGTRSCPQSH